MCEKTAGDDQYSVLTKSWRTLKIGTIMYSHPVDIYRRTI